MSAICTFSLGFRPSLSSDESDLLSIRCKKSQRGKPGEAGSDSPGSCRNVSKSNTGPWHNVHHPVPRSFLDMFSSYRHLSPVEASSSWARANSRWTNQPVEARFASSGGGPLSTPSCMLVIILQSNSAIQCTCWIDLNQLLMGSQFNKLAGHWSNCFFFCASLLFTMYPLTPAIYINRL